MHSPNFYPDVLQFLHQLAYAVVNVILALGTGTDDAPGIEDEDGDLGYLTR
jgi:hypothetical protein